MALYAAVFVLVNATYLALCWEAVDRPAREDASQRMRRLLQMRSFVPIGVFAAAAVVALWWPVVAMVLISLCLVGYLLPDPLRTRAVTRGNKTFTSGRDERLRRMADDQAC